MSLKLSPALQNAMLQKGSFKHVMANCFLKVYSGAQPATAAAAPTGTLLNLYTDAGGAATREVLAQGSVTFSGSIGGTITAITVNSIEILGATITPVTDVTTTAALVVNQINNNTKNLLFVASNVAGKVFITAKPGLGTLANGWAVSTTCTTITKADVNVGTETAGVLAVNGLKWGTSAAGVITKLSTQTWSGTGVATGVAGWFRFEAAVLDAGSLDSTESVMRMDGAIANSGAELNMGNTTITSGILRTLQDFSVTLPTS